MKITFVNTANVCAWIELMRRRWKRRVAWMAWRRVDGCWVAHSSSSFHYSHFISSTNSIYISHGIKYPWKIIIIVIVIVIVSIEMYTLFEVTWRWMEEEESTRRWRLKSEDSRESTIAEVNHLINFSFKFLNKIKFIEPIKVELLESHTSRREWYKKWWKNNKNTKWKEMMC
jgi:hypothetical protein